MPTDFSPSNFESIFDTEGLSDAEKKRLKAIAAGINRKSGLAAVGAMATDTGLQRLSGVLEDDAKADRTQYGQRWRDEQDAAASLREAMLRNVDREEALAFRKQQQADLNEYRRNSMDAAAAARGAAGDARSIAAEERAAARRRGETDKTRREYDTQRSKLGAATAAAQQILAVTSDPALLSNPQAQTALVFSFGRMLDPTSVVREGEYKLFEQGRGVLDTLGNFPERVATGARLTPEQVRNMRQVALGITQRQQQLEQGLGSRYHKLATQRGYDPYEVVGDFTPSSLPPGVNPTQGVGGVPGIQPAGRAYDASGKRIR